MFFLYGACVWCFCMVMLYVFVWCCSYDVCVCVFFFCMVLLYGVVLYGVLACVLYGVFFVCCVCVLFLYGDVV